jgi:hypothetical protein
MRIDHASLLTFCHTNRDDPADFLVNAVLWHYIESSMSASARRSSIPPAPQSNTALQELS